MKYYIQLFFITTLTFSLYTMEVEKYDPFPLEKLLKEIQNIIFSYLPFRSIESNEKLIEKLQEQSDQEQRSKNHPLKKFSNVIERKNFILKKSNDEEELIYLDKTNFALFSSQYDKKILITFRSFAEKLPLFGLLASEVKNIVNLYSPMPHVEGFCVSPNLKYALVLISDTNDITGENQPAKFCIIDLMTKKIKSSHTIPKDFGLGTIEIKSKDVQSRPDPQKVLDLINRGYSHISSGRSISTNANIITLQKEIENIAIANNGTTAAYADSAGIYLVDLDAQKITKKELKNSHIEQITHYNNDYLRRSGLVKTLRFNQQGTQLGVLYKEKSEGTALFENENIELLPTGKEEPEKTLQLYIREQYKKVSDEKVDYK